VKRRIWLVFVYLPEMVSSGPWVLTDKLHFTRRAAQKWVSKLWGDKRVRYVVVDVAEPKL